MSFFVYVLFSEKLKKFYTGSTKDLDDRIVLHKIKFFDNGFTSITDDWVLYHFIECQSIEQARKIELHIKKMKSSIYIRNLKKYPEMSEKLLEKYK